MSKYPFVLAHGKYAAISFLGRCGKVIKEPNIRLIERL